MDAITNTWFGLPGLTVCQPLEDNNISDRNQQVLQLLEFQLTASTHLILSSKA